jgi:CRISPR system Cascade subunit CasD
VSVLLLRLAGPMQAWGSSSRFAQRSTEREPTKSGVLGMIAAAQGRLRTDSITDLLDLSFGVRVDQPGAIQRDFQTARTLDGKTSMPLTYRYYLADAVFVAGVHSDDAGLIQSLHDAVKSPQFPLYLGRRSCPPSAPVAMGIFDGELEDALREVPWQASPWHRRQSKAKQVKLRLLRDAAPGEEGETQRDVPLSFNPTRREYGWRTVVEVAPVSVENPDGTDEDHDPMAELGG